MLLVDVVATTTALVTASWCALVRCSASSHRGAITASGGTRLCLVKQAMYCTLVPECKGSNFKVAPKRGENEVLRTCANRALKRDEVLRTCANLALAEQTAGRVRLGDAPRSIALWADGLETSALYPRSAMQ